MKPQCCCHWGSAIGNRGNGPSGEWPEFGCYECPVHQHGLGEQPTELCKKHKRLQTGK